MVGTQRETLGAFSAIGTFAVLALFVWSLGMTGGVVNELGLLLSGDVREISGGPMVFLSILAVVLTVVVLELPCTIAGGVLQARILGKSGGHAILEMLDRMGEGNHFFLFFTLVVVEEIFARWFFLGILTKIPFLSGPVAFYALFLIGNGLWALMHLLNFRQKHDRQTLRVLPQFVAGIFFTYVFVKYGLLAAILAHFASNAVLLATHKLQRWSTIDMLITGYSAACAVVSYTLMEKPLADTLIWFNAEPLFQIPGWNFWDYLKVSVFSSGVIGAIAGILLYDRSGAGKKVEGKVLLLGYLIVMPIVIGIIYGGFLLLGFFIASAPERILIIVIALAFLHRGTSGSTVARTFWGSLPSTYLGVCILQALGFWPALAWIAATTLIAAPSTFLNQFDD